jgi:hypothetical protein
MHTLIIHSLAQVLIYDLKFLTSEEGGIPTEQVSLNRDGYHQPPPTSAIYHRKGIRFDVKCPTAEKKHIEIE